MSKLQSSYRLGIQKRNGLISKSDLVFHAASLLADRKNVNISKRLKLALSDKFEPVSVYCKIVEPILLIQRQLLIVEPIVELA